MYITKMYISILFLFIPTNHITEEVGGDIAAPGNQHPSVHARPAPTDHRQHYATGGLPPEKEVCADCFLLLSF